MPNPFPLYLSPPAPPFFSTLGKIFTALADILMGPVMGSTPQIQYLWENICADVIHASLKCTQLQKDFFFYNASIELKEKYVLEKVKFFSFFSVYKISNQYNVGKIFGGHLLLLSAF